MTQVFGTRICMMKAAPYLVILVIIVGVLHPAHAQLDPPKLWESVEVPNLEPALENGAAAWGDYDGDGDLDLFYTGYRRIIGTVPGPFAQLYLNQGDYSIVRMVAGSDVEFPATDYVGVLSETDARIQDEFNLWRGSVAWCDYDGDGKIDLATTGINDDEIRETRIYRNTFGESSGDFLQLQFVLPGVSDGDLEWGDWNNDGLPDLAISGLGESGIPVTTIIQNSLRFGQGFLYLSTPGLEGLWNSSLAWGDYDNDMDLDLLATGVNESGQFSTRVYLNKGNFGLSDAALGLPGSLNGSVAWGDGDSDGDLDVLMTGAELGPFLLESSVRVFENNGGQFSSSGSTIMGLFGAEGTGRYAGGAEWGDYDNDGNLDFFVNGFESPTSIETGRTYQSRGDLGFVYSTIGFKNGLNVTC